MPEQPIPFVNKQTSGQESLGGGVELAHNVVVDQLGTAYRRPGITTYPGLVTSVVDANGIVGVYKSLDGQVWAVGGGLGERTIYAIGGSAVSLGGAPSGLRGTLRPTFAETEMLLVIAGGEAPEKVVLSTQAASRLGGNPPSSTHVLANASRLLLNDNTTDRTKVRYSDVATGTASYANLEVWSLGGLGTSGYFSAEGRPDPVVALAEDTNEVLVFGQATLQSFQPDPTIVYSPLSTREVGCSAPYSVVKIDQDFFWLDHMRRFNKGGSRSYEVISDPIQRTVDAIDVPGDCYGYYIALDFIDVLAWTFPTDGRTFVFQKGVGWGQWAGWSDGNWAPLGIGALYMPTDGSDPIVGTTDGRIGTLSLDSATDFDEPIHADVTTGYIDRGSQNKKHCESVKLVLRRGTTPDPTGPQGFLRYRDRPGPWSDPLPIDLGASGERDVVVEFRSLGVYQRRQWKFEYAGTEALTLASASEQFRVLER